MKQLRKITVEPVLGSLIHYYGLRKVSVRGKSGAHKVMVPAAAAFNLKKYLQCKRVKVVRKAIALLKEQESAFSSDSVPFTELFFCQKALEERQYVQTENRCGLKGSCATATTVFLRTAVLFHVTYQIRSLPFSQVRRFSKILRFILKFSVLFKPLRYFKNRPSFTLFICNTYIFNI